MEVASIKGDTALLLYHPAESAAEVGQQFALLELPEKVNGLVVQIISNDSLEYAGLQQEMIQRILQEMVEESSIVLDYETGMGEMKSLKLATAKIRKRIQEGHWRNWDGWIPTRNVELTQIQADDLLGNVLPEGDFSLRRFATFNESDIQLDGPGLNMVNVVTGVKGSGKSHLSKHLVFALSDTNVPCIVFDINGEYTQLPNAQVLRWGDNFLPSLAQGGPGMLSLVVRALYPLSPGSASESAFEGMLPTLFRQRRRYCEDRNQEFTISFDDLQANKWGNQYVNQAIEDRLQAIENMGLFSDGIGTRDGVVANLESIYSDACDKRPIVFDMRDLGPTLQRALVRAMNGKIEDICNQETEGDDRYPFVFYEEAHFYINPDAILNIITRGRHIGMASVFVTNTPQNLPESVFRQLDNLFLLGLTHRDDIRSVSKNSFTDEATIQSFATRMPERHALIIGSATDRYPLVVKVDDLPERVPRTGRTKSTWDRFRAEEQTETEEQTSRDDFFDEEDFDDIPF